MVIKTKGLTFKAWWNKSSKGEEMDSVYYSLLAITRFKNFPSNLGNKKDGVILTLGFIVVSIVWSGKNI